MSKSPVFAALALFTFMNARMVPSTVCASGPVFATLPAAFFEDDQRWTVLDALDELKGK